MSWNRLRSRSDADTLEGVVRPVREPGPSRLPRTDWASRLRGIAFKLVVLLGLAAAAGWALYANLGSNRRAMDMSMRVTSGATPFPVTLGRVERGAITGTVVYTGSVAPFNEEDIYPRVTGRILEMPVYPGDAVRPGQIVARLDSVELSSRVGEAESMLATARANQAQMEADLVAARHTIVEAQRELASMEAELGYAQAVAARTDHLLAVGAVSRQEQENDRAMAASLEAKRDAAQARVEQTRAMEAAAGRKLEAARAMTAQARAALRTATVVRDYVNIVAPTPGYVAKRLVAPGVLVQPGMAILKIAQIDKVRLQANVGEKDVGSIRVGSPVIVTPAGARHAPITARVTAVFPFVDQGPRTAVVEAVMDNAEHRFLPGQYVSMQFVTGSQEAALTVPRAAVTRLGGRARVWVARDGRAEPRDVVTALENPDRVEIASGLAGSETVIVRGHEGLYAGARINDMSGAQGAGQGHRGHGGAPSTSEEPRGPEPAAPMPSDMPPTPGAPRAPGETPHAGH
jgi:HlyD family secretion protein